MNKPHLDSLNQISTSARNMCAIAREISATARAACDAARPHSRHERSAVPGAIVIPFPERKP